MSKSLGKEPKGIKKPKPLDKGKLRKEKRSSGSLKPVRWPIGSLLGLSLKPCQEQPKKGELSVPAILHHDGSPYWNEVAFKVQSYFESKNFKTKNTKQEPFGSDSMFENTVYTLWVSWE